MHKMIPFLPTSSTRTCPPHSRHKLMQFAITGFALAVSTPTKAAYDSTGRPDPAGPDSRAHERRGWRDGVVRAEKKAGDEQKHTLGSCCSQRQVQGSGGQRATEGGTGRFVESRKRACEARSRGVTYGLYSWNQTQCL